MAKTDRFYIGQLDGDGLNTSLKPFAIPDNAFSSLNNAYVFRGRVKKRFGSKLMRGSVPPDPGLESLQSRLRIPSTGAVVGNTDASGDFAAIMPGGVYVIGQKFMVFLGASAEIFTVVVKGTPGIMTTTGLATVKTFDTTTGAVVINGSIANASVIWVDNNTQGIAGVGATDINGNAVGVVPGSKFKAGQLFSVGTQTYTSSQSVPHIMTNGSTPINLGPTDGSGNAAGIVPGALGLVGQVFVIGDQGFRVTAPAGALTAGPGTGTGTFIIATGAYTFTGATAGTDILWYKPVATFNTTTGQFTIASGAPSTQIYFYPAEPVMGLPTYQVQSVLNELVFAFDTQFAYKFDPTGWTRLGTAVWTGSNSQFFWGSTYRGPSAADNFLWVTNYNSGTNIANSDVMKYWNGTVWFDFNPRIDPSVATSTIVTARIIYPYKGRLILLNTVENTGAYPGVNTTYVNRVRYSWLGDPTASVAFYDDPQYGSYEDAPTKEAIVAAQFLKDRLIVYFEQSTWELVYTSNEVRPFVWQQINTEFGAESTFSQVPFDKVVLGVGNVGIIACNGSNVERIDDKIPDSVFDIHIEDSGIARVAGIRDYEVETVYWTFPSSTRSGAFPFNNKVVVYNYKNSSWSYNDDSITAFGYYQPSANEGETWESNTNTWQADTSTWQDGIDVQPRFRTVLSGNQEGFTFIVDPYLGRNSPALQITSMFGSSPGIVTIKCINHNLQPGFNVSGDYVYIEDCSGVTGVNGKIYAVNAVIDPDNFTIAESNLGGVYAGNGTLARVSNINIITKQYNFYANQGRNALINKVDFLVDKTTDGQVTVDYALSSSSESTLLFGKFSGALLGTGVLETSPYALIPFEQTQDRLWHPIYPIAEGECIQLQIYMNDAQIRNASIAFSDFELHAQIYYTQVTSSRLQ